MAVRILRESPGHDFTSRLTLAYRIALARQSKSGRDRRASSRYYDGCRTGSTELAFPGAAERESMSTRPRPGQRSAACSSTWTNSLRGSDARKPFADKSCDWRALSPGFRLRAGYASHSAQLLAARRSRGPAPKPIRWSLNSPNRASRRKTSSFYLWRVGRASWTFSIPNPHSPNSTESRCRIHAQGPALCVHQAYGQSMGQPAAFSTIRSVRNGIFGLAAASCLLCRRFVHGALACTATSSTTIRASFCCIAAARWWAVRRWDRGCCTGWVANPRTFPDS